MASKFAISHFSGFLTKNHLLEFRLSPIISEDFCFLQTYLREDQYYRFMSTRTELLPFDGKPNFVNNDGNWRETGLWSYQYKVAYNNGDYEEQGVSYAHIKAFVEALEENIATDVRFL